MTDKLPCRKVDIGKQVILEARQKLLDVKLAPDDALTPYGEAQLELARLLLERTEELEAVYESRAPSIPYQVAVEKVRDIIWDKAKCIETAGDTIEVNNADELARLILAALPAMGIEEGK